MMISQSTFFVVLVVPTIVLLLLSLLQEDFVAVHSFSPNTILTTRVNNQKCPIPVQVRTIHPTQQLQLVSNDNNNNNDRIVQSSRQEFLSKMMMIGTIGGILTTTIPVALAADDKAVGGTKKDPVYEACLSQCMYDCTKPKGYEQKSRSECLPECKKSCAKTPAQLLLGTPIKK